MEKVVASAEKAELSEWEAGSFFMKWSFSIVNNLLAIGEKEPLQFEHMLRIPKRDSSSVMIGSLKHHYETSTAVWFMPRLIVALIKFTWFDVSLIAIYTVLEAGCMVVSPLLLRYFLAALGDGSSAGECFMWAAILSGVGYMQVFIHAAVFFLSMRTGWNWKNASTALIHDKLIRMDANVLQSSGASTGMLVNMISNDVARFEEFTVFGMSFWVSLVVLIVILVELIFVLDVPSAVTGVGCTCLMLPAMIVIAKRFAQYRGQTAASTDSRVRYISEVIDGIASVKSYAWETAFFQMIRELRQTETKYIAKAQALRAVNQGIMFCTAAVVAFATFGVYWGNGGELTVPLVFATISLLQVLRFQIGRAWTRSIETGSEAIASSLRIESFLALDSRSSKLITNGDAGNSVPPASDSATTRASPVLTIKPSSYCYGTDTSNPILRNVSFSVARGELLMVVGPVGSGKSSLLAVALGELHAIDPAKTSSADETVITGTPGQPLASMQSVRSISDSCRVAYCAQRPWILAASVKSNITLAGAATSDSKMNYKNPTNVDLALYSKAVESSLIVDDMMQWPAYDDTEVGERGISVSGGQKARISLARAIYSDADLYVLDDPLSAVDAHVGRALMSNCIVDTLKKGNKATILVTHQLQYLEFADSILVLDSNGNQTFYGSYYQLQASPAVLSSLDMIKDSFEAAKSADGSPHSTHRKTSRSRGSSVDVSLAGTAPRKASRSESLGADPGVPQLNPAVLAAAVHRKIATKYDPDFRAKMRASESSGSPKKGSMKAATANTTVESKTASTIQVSETRDVEAADGGLNGDGSDCTEEEEAEETELECQRRKIVEAEDRVMGNMSLGVYWRYICSGGAWRGSFALFVIFVSQGIIMITEYWLRWWATNAFGDQRDIKYILIFAGLVVITTLIGFYRALGWFQFTLRAASNLQEKCLWAVIHSPMTFFVSNPTGRILNRFSRDQNQVDELLPATIFTFLETAIYCLASVILICITIPWLALLIPFLIGFFVMFRQKYICSTREIKRIEAITRSPIYADFSATLEGLTTLRAYKLESRVCRLFQEQVDDNARVWFSYLMCARWLGLRLDLETSVILSCVCILAVILRDTMDVGLLGFALVYTMSLSGLFQWTVRQSVEVETQMTSVERIGSYALLPPEAGYTSTLAGAIASSATVAQHRAAHVNKERNYEAVAGVEASTDSSPAAVDLRPVTVGTQHKGNLLLKDLTVTYRADLDPVLKNININISAGYKVGICGRTGSGKSSTLLALLRLNIITSGDIVLDGESLLAMDLQSARSRLSIIPQDPHLFSGTIRFNLDPFSVYSDMQIWAALQDAHIHDHIKQDPLGLSAVVEESGKNFSVGQRQLLSLARAILRESKVVLMDEVTASIDYLTDRLIQETIRTSPALRDSTIITVAHRLRTIADSDLIVVIQAGEVVEMGAPGTLLLESKGKANITSHFTKLVQESNEYDEIFKIATAKLNNKPTI